MPLDCMREMDEMLTDFDQQATYRLRRISRSFELSGQSFNAEFRNLFLQMSTGRLSTSYAKVEMEQLLKGQSRNRNEQRNLNPVSALLIQSGNVNCSPTNTFEADKELKYLNTLGFVGNASSNDANALIEIVDSSDEGGIAIQDEAAVDEDVNQIKEEPNVEPKLEIVDDEDIPLTTFNPNNVVVDDQSDDDDDNISALPLTPQTNKKKPQMNRNPEVQKQPNGEPAKRFKCEICEFATKWKSHLTTHMRIHLGEAGKKFKCDICGFGTVHKRSLVSHILVHTDEKPHQCGRCSKRFRHAHHLKGHIVTHENKKLPYFCVGCFRRFARKEEKEAHGKSCPNRRYECHLCRTYVTGYKQQMEYHMRLSHSGDKPFRCEVCMKNFRSKCNLRQHLNTVHSKIGSKNRK